MSELKPCPFCGKEPAIDNNFAICVNDDCEQSDYWDGLEVDTWNTRPIEDALNARIAELEEENDRLQDGWFRDETICPDGSLRPKVSDLLNRIAELSQAVGLITTLKPTMVMDANHPLDMVREVGEHVTARIAELEAENNRLAELLHNELSSLEIATDLGNKRWVALNDIYKNGEKHNANWCKRIAQKGLGIK